jgi:hypothetical protein
MTGYIVPNPPFVSPKATVTAKAADATLTVAEVHGSQITNTGAAATITLTLPDPATAGGCAFRVQLTVAQIVRLLPPTGKKVYLGGSGVASKYLNIAAVIGNYCDVFCDGIDYLVTSYSGVVTKEA